MSKAAADVLRQFDLGGGALYPVKVFKKDRVTPIDGEFFCINFGNRREAFLPEESRNIEIFVRDIWLARARMADNDFAFSKSAQAGPSIWLEPKVDSSFFLRFELGNALKKARADKGFLLKKCRVI